MGAPTEKLKKEEVEAKQSLGEHASARGLEGAYSDDEPEYTLDMLIAVNPEYERTQKECDSEPRVPARGLEDTCSDDKPECTTERKVK